MKHCNKCDETKDLSEFHKLKTNEDGYHYYCKLCRKTLAKKYYENNKEKIYLKNREYQLNNPEKNKLSSQKYRERNREKINQLKREYKQKRKQEDSIFALSERIRRRILKSFSVNKWNKNNTTQEILGCTYEELFKYIESKFTEGMCWERMGEIHIDHIIPLATAKTEKEIYKLNHYTNLQPLWAKDNLSKSAKIL